jgi:hypothetical protein
MKSTASNINTALSKLVTNPREFRSHQAACNALLYSEFARCFFARTTHCTNLCISCGVANDNGESAQAYASFRAYLYQEGYLHKRDADGDDEPWTTKAAASGEVMCIYISDTTTPVTEAFSQATTAGLNVISWSKAMSFFPYDTLVNKRCFMLQDVDDVVDPDEKPVSENVVAFSQAGLKTKAMSRKVPQHLTALTWVVELGTGDVTPSAVPDIVL